MLDVSSDVPAPKLVMPELDVSNGCVVPAACKVSVPAVALTVVPETPESTAVPASAASSMLFAARAMNDVAEYKLVSWAERASRDWPEYTLAR